VANRLFVTLVALGVATACGGRSEAPAPTEATAPAGAESTVQSDGAGMEEAPAPASPDDEATERDQPPVVLPRADAVDFEVLQALLPEVAGWTRTNVRGEQLTTPVAFSRAEAHYERGDTIIELELVDSALSQLLTAPFSMFLASGYAERSSEGSREAIVVNGSPGYEEWTISSGRGEIMALVADRFIVRVSGSGVNSLDTIRAIIDAVDFRALGRLR